MLIEGSAGVQVSRVCVCLCLKVPVNIALSCSGISTYEVSCLIDLVPVILAVKIPDVIYPPWTTVCGVTGLL